MSGVTFVLAFRRAAREHAPRIAVEAHGEPLLTYAELARQAEAIAIHLASRGVGPGDRVALDLAKSATYVVALVGTWMARAVAVPLAPELPAARRDFVVTDAGVTERLTRDDVLTAVSAAPRDRRGERIAPKAEDLAYLLYTSGSSGAPKGVAVAHRGIVSLLTAQIDAFRLRPESRALFYLSTAFDASISDIGTSLLAGATLVIVPPDATRSPRALLEALARERITHADLPPSLLRMIDPASAPEALETIIAGGEACAPEVIRRWAARVRVVNVYGPTEATVCSSLCVCDAEGWSRPLIGDPLPGVRYRVVDDALRDVAVGTPGELLIGGIGLADGYWRRPELTAARFVLHEGERVYRTGDRVVANAEGEIEFLGRLDRQIKLRGRRIEPAEIEAALRGAPGVGEAAVAMRSRGGEHRSILVAFVVPRDADDALDVRAMREALARALPPWMIPHRFVALARLPRTTSSKIDYGALAAEPLPMRARASSPRPRRAGWEALLAEAWCDVLDVEEVDDADDLAAAGGDSMSVLELVVAAEARGIALSPEQVMATATFGALLDAIRRASSDDAAARAASWLDAEVSLDDTWRARLAAAAERDSRETPAHRVTRSPRAILVTGATGMLGSRLVHAIARRIDAPLICLVRAVDDAAADARLARALRDAGGEPPMHRVRALRGDVSRPWFGLDPRAWSALAREVDVVYHAAAEVHLLARYEALRASNVDGTREVARFVLEGAPKRLHHVSTLSVFVSAERAPGLVHERDDLASTRAVFGGYAQTKFAAERFLRALGAAAGPIAIYRLGLLVGDSSSSVAARDQLALFMRGIAELGVVPRGDARRLSLDVTPVDYAAEALAHISLGDARDARDRDRTFHIANPESTSLDALLAAMRAEGVRLDDVDDARWSAAAARAHASGDTALAYLALCRAAHDGAAYGRHRTIDLLQATGFTFGMDATRRALDGSGIICPPATLDRLRRYVARALARGEAS